MTAERFHDILKVKLDDYVNRVYDCTMLFPRDELYGVTSQLRRSALSVVLNYIEGYARGRERVMKNFLEIAYGSLKESKYLLYFSFKRKYLGGEDYIKLLAISEEIGRMLWGIITKIN